MGSAGVIRVLIAEDDVLVREGAVQVLQRAEGIDVAGTADCGECAEVAIVQHDPDVVVLDIRMPPTHTTEGLDIAGRLREERPGVGIVVLSQHADPEYALELFRDGSEGRAYLLKERLGDVAQLEQAIRTVHDGGSVLDPVIVDALLEAKQRRSRSRLAGLSPREIEVLAHMAAGMANAAIAERLVISQRSVEKHVRSIFDKLGLVVSPDTNRRVAAVTFYLHELDA